MEPAAKKQRVQEEAAAAEEAAPSIVAVDGAVAEVPAETAAADEPAAPADESEPNASTLHEVGLIFDTRMKLHAREPGAIPPIALKTGELLEERPERIACVHSGLAGAGLLDRCLMVPAREATADEIFAVHSPGCYSPTPSRPSSAAVLFVLSLVASSW